MSDVGQEPMPYAAPFPATDYASQASGRRTIDGSVLEWPNWRVLTGKVAKANAIVAEVLTVLAVAYTTLLVSLARPTIDLMVYSVVVLLLSPVVGYVLGFIPAYMGMWLLFLPVKLTLCVLRWRPADKQVAMTSGSVVALIWTLPVVRGAAPLGLFEIAFSTLGLTMSVFAGKIGAVLALIDRFREPAQELIDDSGLPRFSVRTLLAVMIPICVTLTLFRWLGLLRVETLVIILAWLVLQHFLRKPAVRLTLWWLDRQAKKQELPPRPDIGIGDPAEPVG